MMNYREWKKAVNEEFDAKMARIKAEVEEAMRRRDADKKEK